MDANVVRDHGYREFDPSAANRPTVGLVHGIASRPKPKAKPPTTPATGSTP